VLCFAPSIPPSTRGDPSDERHTHLRHPITAHHNRQNPNIQPRKQRLRDRNVPPPLSEAIERGVDVDVRGRVDERAGAALDEGVVALAGEVLRHLLHVGLPVDFRVCTNGVSGVKGGGARGGARGRAYRGLSGLSGCRGALRGRGGGGRAIDCVLGWRGGRLLDGRDPLRCGAAGLYFCADVMGERTRSWVETCHEST